MVLMKVCSQQRRIKEQSKNEKETFAEHKTEGTEI